MIHRDPDLLYAVRFLPCQLQVDDVCLGPSAPAVACHSNRERHGKGKSQKAADAFVAAGCDACHAFIDQPIGSDGPSRDEKFAIWQFGHERTLHLLFLRGMLVVATAWRKPLPGNGDLVAQQNALAQQPIVRKRPAPRKRPSKTGHQNGRSTESPSKCKIGAIK